MKAQRIIGNIFIFLTGAVLISSIWVKRHFSMPSIDEIIFHLKTSVSGTDWITIRSCILYFVILVVVFIAIALIGNKILKKVNKKWLYLVYLILPIVMFVGSFYVPYKFFNIKSYVESIDGDESKYIEDNYVDPNDVEITFPKKKQNLIVLYLESMESSYASKKDGGLYDKNYIPNLTKLAEENVQFSNDKDLGGGKVLIGTSWTTGGVVGINSGIPIKVGKLLEGTTANDYHFSFKNAYSLGDILDDNNYNQELMLGSKVMFGGLYEYFHNHGELTIKDVDYLRNHKLTKDNDSNYWGIKDSKLFDLAKKDLTDLSKDSNPFALSLMTMNTHCEDGFTESSCSNKYKNKYANSIYCSDKQIFDFVNWIKEQDFYDNTTIVILGDHLSMNTSLFENIDFDSRTIYNVFINSKATTDNVQNRVFTNLDMFPTILSSLGVNIVGDRLGLGTNLFSKSKTLPEKDGYNYFNDELNKKSSFYKELY